MEGEECSFWIYSEGGADRGSIEEGGGANRDLRWLLGVESDLRPAATGN